MNYKNNTQQIITRSLPGSFSQNIFPRNYFYLIANFSDVIVTVNFHKIPMALHSFQKFFIPIKEQMFLVSINTPLENVNLYTKNDGIHFI